MSHRFDIRFVDDDRPRYDNVVVAIVPIDAFTGRIVSSGVAARIEGIPDRPWRNGSGMLVFVKRNTDDLTDTKFSIPDPYRIILTAKEAGYFDPEPIDFTSPASDDPRQSDKRRQVVLLYRRPTVIEASDATTVAGVVVRNAQPAVGTHIEARLPTNLLPPGSQSLRPFETRSDERGAFVLFLRVPETEPGTQPEPESETGKVTFKFTSRKIEGAPEIKRELNYRVQQGKSYGFRDPIELTDSNGEKKPDLLSFEG